MTTLGVLTIGQSPRTDLTSDLAVLLPDVRLVEAGALDGLSTADIDKLAPGTDGRTLISRLRTGKAVTLDHERIGPLLQHALDQLEEQLVDATLLVCTGGFPALSHRRPLLDAERLIVHGIAALSTSVREIGVVAPLPEQRQHLAERWRSALGRSVVTDAADPYSQDAAAGVEGAVERLAACGADLIILDCIGFTLAMRRRAARLGVPIVVARSLAARLVGEFLSSHLDLDTRSLSQARACNSEV